MKYLSLLFIVAAIAAGAHLYLNQLSTQSSLQLHENYQAGGESMNPIDLAKDAKELMEGIDVNLAEEVVEEKSESNNQTEEAMQNEESKMVATKTPTQETNISTETMLVAGGCFWCVEADLEKLTGVVEAVSGYAEGSNENPTYDNYSKNGHREVVEVTYNPAVVTFEEILIYAMKHMDPTDGDGSFHDRGKYYAPAFYYENDAQKAIITNLIADVDANGPYDKALEIDVLSRPTFWKAEDFHQNYYKGTLSQLKYKYYRNASGRDTFIEKYWGTDTGTDLSWRTKVSIETNESGFWKSYVKPSKDELKNTMEEIAFKVTQEEGTEKPFTSPYDKFWEDGIYVDTLSGEPLFSSKDKFDSGTGWPSFVKPITSTAVTEHIDKSLFSTRTEIRSAISDNHLGHVFSDGPSDRGGLRYCMNGVALRFVAKDEMQAGGYGDYLYLFEV